MLFLTPSQPFLRDASKRVSARLVGDMAGYQQEAQLDGKWLMVPFARGESRSRGRRGHDALLSRGCDAGVAGGWQA